MVVHPNQGYAGGLLLRGMHSADVHSGSGQAGLELIAEDVVADASEHLHGDVSGAGASGGAGLIRAFTTG